MKKITRFILVVLLGGLLLITAKAQTTNTDAAGNTSGNTVEEAAAVAALNAAVAADNGGTITMRAIGGLVKASLGTDLTNRFVTAALAISANLKTYALVLAGSLALASMLWNIMIAMASRDSPMDAAIEAVIFASLVAFLIANYERVITDIVSIGESLIAGMGAGDLGQAVANFIDGYFAKMIDTIVRGFAGMASFTGWFSGALDLLISAVLLIIATYFGITALIELIGVVLIGPVVLAVGISLGPVFVACLASHWTRSWFSKWLEFVINGAVLTAVVVLVVTLINNVIIAANPLAGGSLTAEALTLALISVALAKVFSGIPGMVDSLLPGRFGIKAITSKERGDAAKAAAGAGQAVSKGVSAAGAKAIPTGRAIMAAGAAMVGKVAP